jgi:cytochrome P450
MTDRVVLDESLLLGPPALFQPGLAAAASHARTALDPDTGALFVLHRADIEPLLHDPRLAGVGLAVFDAMGVLDGPLRAWYGALMFTTEGETHHRLRSLVQRAFTPRSVESLRPFAAERADRLLAPLASAGAGDLNVLAERLPIEVMARHLGVPDADVDALADWSTALAPVFGFMSPEQIATATVALAALFDYLDDLFGRRAAEPADDVITRLLAGGDGGARLTHVEARNMVANLIVGGHDTSTSQIACSLLVLLTHPDELARLRRQPQLLASATEETMRCLSSLGGTFRVARSDIELNGITLRTGQLCVLATGIAGLEQDATLDVGRFAHGGDTPRMLNFGAGPHYCLGASLARVVVQEAIAAVLRLPPPLTLTREPDDIPWVRILGAYPMTLPIAVGTP